MVAVFKNDSINHVSFYSKNKYDFINTINYAKNGKCILKTLQSERDYRNPECGNKKLKVGNEGVITNHKKIKDQKVKKN